MAPNLLPLALALATTCHTTAASTVTLTAAEGIAVSVQVTGTDATYSVAVDGEVSSNFRLPPMFAFLQCSPSSNYCAASETPCILLQRVVHRDLKLRWSYRRCGWAPRPSA
jgi:hypothetical protein